MLVLLPLVLHCLHDHTATPYPFVYGFEVVVTPIVLALLAAPSVVIAMFALFALIANWALWGARSWPTMLAFGGAVVSQGWYVIQSASYEAAAFSGASFLVVSIAHLAHQQTQRILTRRGELALQNQRLKKFLPPDVADASGSAQTTWLTVAFVDLAGFTDAMEVLPDRVIHHVLNDFLGEVSSLVAEHGGYVSKFLGDGVLCVFRAHPEQNRGEVADQAVRAGLKLPGLMDRLNATWLGQGYLRRFGATCGIASGYACVGEWGQGDRLDFTVVGECVNLASRLQTEAGMCGQVVMVDEVTRSLAACACDRYEELSVELKGSKVQRAFVPELDNSHCESAA